MALLAHSTIREAAAACGVAESTLGRWVRLPEFQARYREARRAAVEQAVGELQRLTTAAAQTLHRNLTCGVPSAEIRAALGILDQGFKGVELLELEERLASLEAIFPAPETVWRRAG